MKRFALLCPIFLALSACAGAQYHRDAVSADRKSAITVGAVQRQIQVGMSGGQVVEALGEPNVVTTDEERRQVWIYDKISTERAYSVDQGGIATLILGGALIGDGLVGGGVAPSYAASSGASSTTQKTLTVIIKFDNANRVRDFKYHSTTF
mgnify:CR=1 FL=1